MSSGELKGDEESCRVDPSRSHRQSSSGILAQTCGASTGVVVDS